ncbi:MAG TPA: Na+-transporting NADH:ubiquinone oxidoreductase subunit D [Bacteroidales bacterium]|nr:Na+-transporting NADH:ubiquinone oxidoreductase subunit D [Bacteroidales bacterium]
MSLLSISASPHIQGDYSVKKIMWGVVYALIPASLVAIYFFGLDAIRVMLIAVAASLFFEWLIQKYLIKGTDTYMDGSAVITGLLLAFNVPSNLPWWIVVIGALVAIGIGKMSFGGLGKNVFNPALVGRVFMLISFPVQMTSWPTSKPLFSEIADAITGPTPLGIVKEGLDAGLSVNQVMAEVPSFMQQFVGGIGGSLGEVSALALILGGIFMLWKKIITWEIPLSVLLSAFLFSGLFWLIDPTHYVNPIFHLLTGGMMLGAIFMATDMVSSPMARNGQLVFGVGIGLLTVTIRIWGAYPEGMSFAILIMNGLTPLINTMFKPKRFGRK